MQAVNSSSILSNLIRTYAVVSALDYIMKRFTLDVAVIVFALKIDKSSLWVLFLWNACFYRTMNHPSTSIAVRKPHMNTVKH